MRKFLAIMATVCCAGAINAQTDTIPFAQKIPINPGDSRETIIAKAAHVIPTDNQADAIEREFIAFVHFGPNTFTRMEWGTGKEDPKIFAPTGLDTDQWVKAMKDAGMKMIILTVKHHDGFVLWQSRYTKHGIMSSPFMDGKGDILRNLSASAQKYCMKLGVYLSPADLYQIENEEGLYGNLSPKTLRTIPREVEGRPFENPTKFEFVVDDYNEYFLNQLFELLTEYGPIHEVWFDGAHPKRKGGQTYNYEAWEELIHTLAPKAVMFGRGDVRWCGNEAGNTRDTEWNVLPFPRPSSYDKVLGNRERLYVDTVQYLHYILPEVDTSIREGWFFRDDNTQKVRTADAIYDIYERSVGGNAVLLLNIPPGPDGRLGEEDVAVLGEVGRRARDTYGTDLLAGAKVTTETLPGDKYPSTVIALPKPVTVNRFVVQEPIRTGGERIEEHELQALVDGKWITVAKATNVGHKRILRFADVTTDSLRLRILSSRLEPSVAKVSAHYYKAGAPEIDATRSLAGNVTIAPKKANFNWHGAPTDAPAALIPDYTVHYTLDGSTPTAGSPQFPDSLFVEGVRLKAKAYLADGTEGALLDKRFGYAKASFTGSENAMKAVDEKTNSAWIASDTEKELTLDLGGVKKIAAIEYTPALNARGAIAKARIEVSDNGKKFKDAGSWDFGNLTNDPTPRIHILKKAVKARYIRIIPEETADGKNAVAVEIGILPSI